MAAFEWNEEKNKKLKEQRGVCFNDAVEAFNSQKVLLIAQNPAKRYPHQKIAVLDIDNYAYVVPYIQVSKDKIFLKTVIPSRKFTKKYITAKKHNENK